MRKQSLMQKSLTQFIVCVAVLLFLAMPLFYWLTKNFYAEDMMDIIEAVKNGGALPATDLEEDIMHGVMIQFVLIVAVLGIALVLTMRFISKRLWLPFDKTLESIEAFRLENGDYPRLGDSDIREFSRLNGALEKMMADSLHSYRMEKEFTENASHELQTPLAIFQSKLDLLLQQPDITEQQAAIIQDLYQMNGRLSRLSRNLLLLAKMENGQFSRMEPVDIVGLLDELAPYLDSIAGGVKIVRRQLVERLSVRANRPLLESLLYNLVVNAVRHNRPDGEILIAVEKNGFTISNTSEEPALDGAQIFNRFYRSGQGGSGNGLGLAIVKAVCDYHGWTVAYVFRSGVHEFDVRFG